MDASVIRDPYGMGGIDSRPVLTPHDPIERQTPVPPNQTTCTHEAPTPWTPEMQREHDDAEQVRDIVRQTRETGNDDFAKGLKLYNLQMWLSRLAFVVPVVLFAIYYIWVLLTDET